MPTQTDALSSVYARSLYDLAEDAGGRDKIQEIGSELEQICELARVDKRFTEFLASPVLDIKRRADAMRRIFSDRVTDLTLRFLLVLNDKGRLRNFDSINVAFDQLVQEAYGMIEVDLITPTALDVASVDAIKTRIRVVLGKEPVVHQYTDKAMIGGLKLRIGDQLIDGSVATRLRRMKQGLLSSGGEEIRSRIREFIHEDQD